MIKKIVFIDTNIFINCALVEARDAEKVADLDTLKDIKEKLDDNKMILVLPENIRAEVNANVSIRFKEIIEVVESKFAQIKKHINESVYSKEIKKDGKISKLVEEELEKSKINSIEELEKSKINSIKEIKNILKPILDTINDIFNHKNTEIIELSNDILMAGIRRSALMKRPYTPPSTLQVANGKNKKSAYLKDQDCIAFETLLDYLRNKLEESKEIEFIICSDDIDYFENFENNILHKDIRQDIKCENITGCNDILDMLKNEFGKTYTKEQIKKYKTSLDEVQNINGSFAYDSLGYDASKVNMGSLENGWIQANHVESPMSVGLDYGAGKVDLGMVATKAINKSDIVSPMNVDLGYDASKFGVGNLGIYAPLNANGAINPANVDLGHELGKSDMWGSRIVASSETLKRKKKM